MMTIIIIVVGRVRSPIAYCYKIPLCGYKVRSLHPDTDTDVTVGVRSLHPVFDFTDADAVAQEEDQYRSVR